MAAGNFDIGRGGAAVARGPPGRSPLLCALLDSVNRSAYKGDVALFFGVLVTTLGRQSFLLPGAGAFVMVSFSHGELHRGGGVNRWIGSCKVGVYGTARKSVVLWVSDYRAPLFARWGGIWRLFWWGIGPLLSEDTHHSSQCALHTRQTRFLGKHRR